MINRYAIIVTVIIGATFAGCSKFLDKKSNTGLSSPNSVAVLQALMDNSDVFNIGATPSFGEASCDDYFIGDNDYARLSENTRNAYVWTPANYKYLNDWAKGYTVVYNANLCLESLAKIPATPLNNLQWNYLKGAALFHRAYAFLNLAWVFSEAYDMTTSNVDPGLDLRLQTDYNIPSKRSSVEETYTRILADARESLNYLPDSTVHVFRPCKSAAYGLLARAFLSMRLYDSAYKYANKCLQLNNDLIDYNTIRDNGFPFASTAYSRETVFYSTMMTAFPSELIDPSYGYERIDTNLYRTYKDNDLRKKLFFKSNGNYVEFKGGYATANYYIFSGLTTAEMYLTRAECNAHLGLLKECLLDLNTLLKKRLDSTLFVPVNAGSVEDALALVLKERRKELVMRGVRWMDIKRLNKEGANITLQREVSGTLVTLQPNDKRYALPLPADIISRTGMVQN